MRISRLNSTVQLLALVLSLVAGQAAFANDSQPVAPQWNMDTSPLIDKVRAATARFKDVNVAVSEGWVPTTPCVSGPDTGAMGVHFVNSALVGKAVLQASEPEALIYEPGENGAFRLVGVEFIILAPVWEKSHTAAETPALDGNLLNYVAAPNRYGLPAFYELHVWAWEHNPKGSFADWNTHVSCDRQARNRIELNAILG